jgi:hypothetical protein
MYIYNFGQPSGSTSQPVLPATPPITPPRGLILVEHKMSTGPTNITNMTPSEMNPGFLNVDDKVNINPTLQQKLTDLFKKPEYARLVPKRAIRVALVDLTGDKLWKPQYAGYHSTLPIYAASTIKYAILYAAHQLVFDLNQLTQIGNIQTAADLKREANNFWSNLKCKPDVNWLVTFDESSREVSASQSLKESLKRMTEGMGSDMSASKLILKLGFEFIGSVIWSSGLYHLQRKGMWIGNTFEAAPRLERLNPACHKGQQPVIWARNPFGGNIITALSGVAFFTLLAQRRLVSDRDSAEIENLLKDACSLFSSPSGVTVRATKCGLLKYRARHRMALMEGPGRRYAFAILTTDPYFKPHPDVPVRTPVFWSAADQFVADLDQIIKDNNP